MILKWAYVGPDGDADVFASVAVYNDQPDMADYADVTAIESNAAVMRFGNPYLAPGPGSWPDSDGILFEMLEFLENCVYFGPSGFPATPVLELI